jgi:hypothetical protein
MSNLKSNVIILAAMTTFLLGTSGPTPCYGSEPKLTQVVYITRSKACGCSAKSVKAADAAIAQVFAGPRQALLKRIDYDTNHQAALPYIGEFRLIQLPAVLFLDGQGHLLWSAIGSVELNKLEEQIKEFGA